MLAALCGFLDSCGQSEPLPVVFEVSAGKRRGRTFGRQSAAWSGFQHFSTLTDAPNKKVELKLQWMLNCKHHHHLKPLSVSTFIFY